MVEVIDQAKHKSSKPVVLWLSVILLVILAGVGGTILVAKQKPEILGLSKGAVDPAEEVNVLVAQVKKLIALPDEVPTIATVSDIEKLANQPFFANARNGDKVLIFANSKKAILFRPSQNLIIDVAPINTGASPSAVISTPVPAKITFVLKNGTETVGLTKKFETVLIAKVPNASVVDRDNAVKRDWEKSILVDTSGAKTAEALSLSQTLGIEVGKLPPGEATGASDFLIILGLDAQ